MNIIDGAKIAREITEKIKTEISTQNLKLELAIIMVGNNPASTVYVRNKEKICAEVGIKTNIYQFNENVSEEELKNCIFKLNNLESVHGIIVQLPLPQTLNENKIINYIAPKKDVDGLTSNSLGLLIQNREGYIPATIAAIIKLLEYENISLNGKNVVIVGRSNLVGKPLALALLNRDATVTITHSKTKNLKDITKSADILIVAIRKPNFLTSDYIKDGVIIIDVGINKVNAKIVGDVDFKDVSKKASYITPVPGGVGPMTIAMLLNNVLESSKNKDKN